MATPAMTPVLPAAAGVDGAAPGLTRLCGTAGLVLCIIAFWMLEHPYEGIVHDSVLYAFSALARLHPASLGHDVYLSLGVQDRYTLFSPMAASLIRVLGLERSAQLITLVAQVAFFGGGWLLARSLLPAAEALLSLALLVILPAVYGDAHIFSYAESFMTPRLPSEALVLGALVSAMGGRTLLAALCLMGAALLHPIIACAGAMFLFVHFLGLRRPRLAAGIACAGFVAIIGAAWLAPFGPVARFDTGWFDLLYSRGAYLFPSRWPLADWAHASVPLATLAVGAVSVSERRARLVAIAALATGLGGLALSLVGADALRIVLIAQAQPWRCLWLSNALAVVLMPAIFRSCWGAGDAKRCAIVLLAAAWVCIDEPYAVAIGLFALGIASMEPRGVDPRRARLMLAGAWVILAFSLLALAGYVLHVIGEVARIPPERSLYDSPYLLKLRRWKSWQAGGILPACIFLGAWWAAGRSKRPAGALILAALGIGLCAAFARFAWNAWTKVDMTDALYAQFDVWREVIPERAQVLWTDSAYPTWFLLERASYWSQTQNSASVFSEPLARELARREWVITAIRDSAREPRQLLRGLCEENPALDFYVSSIDMGPSPYPLIGDPKGSASMRLYRCADYRK